MNRTCENRVKDCCIAGQSGEFGNPLANLSSEAPDVETFFSLNWRRNNPGGGTPTGRFDCFSVCESQISQIDADLCAKQQADECAIINEPPIRPCQARPCPNPCDNPPCDIPPVRCLTPPCEVPPVPCLVPPCNPTPILYCNDETTCGPEGCEVTIPACAVTAANKADANAIAASLCNHYAFLCQRRRPPVPPTPPIPPTPPGCPSFTAYGQTSPVTVAEGETVTLSVTISYTGPGPLIYVWYVNGFPLAVTPGPSLALNNVTGADSGTYTLGVSAPGCAPILSDPIILDVDTCFQGGSPVPEFVYDPGNPVDVGTFEITPNGVPVDIGAFAAGSFTVQYVGGAWTNMNNPCPGAYKMLNGWTFSTGVTVEDIGDPNALCGSSQGDFESQFVAAGERLSVSAAATTPDNAFFNPINAGGASKQSSFPTWHVTFFPLPSLDPLLVDDFLNVGPKLINPAWTNAAVGDTDWDGTIAGDTAWANYLLYITYTSGCNPTYKIGGKKIQNIQADGPVLGSDIVFFLDGEGVSNPEFVNFGTNLVTAGIINPALRYWVFQTYDCCHPGCEPGFLGWYGIKSYGSDATGRYQKLYGAHPEAPECVTLLQP